MGGLVGVVGAMAPAVGQAARVPLCDQSEVCRVHRENGFQLYEAKNYGDALTEFEAAYATKAEPRLLLNIGRSLFRLDRPGEALQRYQQFREQSPALDAATQESLARYITEAEAAKAAQEKATADKDAAARAEEIRRRMAPTRPLNIAKWSLAGAGVLMTIAGAVMLGLDGRPACDLATGQKLCPEELNTKLGGGILLGAGLLSLGGSGALFGLDYKRTHDGALRAQVAFGMRF